MRCHLDQFPSNDTYVVHLHPQSSAHWNVWLSDPCDFKVSNETTVSGGTKVAVSSKADYTNHTASITLPVTPLPDLLITQAPPSAASGLSTLTLLLSCH